MLLLVSLAVVGCVIFLASAAGFAATPALMPASRRLERSGWGVFLGIAALAASAALGCVVPGVSRRIVTAVVLGLLAAGGLRRRGVVESGMRRPEPSWSGADAALALIVAGGVLVYLVRALTEPMWSNDYLAIWGLKGKTIFAARAFPVWPFRSPDAGFSHPEYPVGLPLALAGIAGAVGRWDDHAMALLFPTIQAATLAVLFGWLRRRGATRRIALAATALVSLCELLFSAFLTGLAEIPLAGAVLLLAASWSDALDDTDTGAVRRLAAASALSAALKNEGLFLAAAAALLTVLMRRSRARWRAAAACLLPAAAVWAAHRAALGFAALRDFDPGLLAPGRLPEMPARAAEALAAVGGVAWRPGWPALLALAAIGLAGRRSAAADRILTLAAVALVAYLALPILAVRGTDWLIRTSFVRTSAGLAPAVAAALALRVAALSGANGRDESSAAGADRAASESCDARPIPSTRAS